MLYIETASYTERGGHNLNEDSFCCSNDLFVVADGLGGHINGEKASQCVIEYLKNNAHGDYSENTIKDLLTGANSAVLTQAQGAKTTIAVLFAENGVFRYANVGDSRVYIFRGGKVIAMTKDHSVCQAAVDMGTMSFDEIRRSEDRSRLLKVLGNDEKLVIPKGYPPIEMQEGDAFLICSDGFWDYVLESEMEADLLKSETPKEWLEHMLKRHLAAAMNKGDNYTAICGIVRSKQETSSAPPAKVSKAWFIVLPIIAVAAAVAAFLISSFLLNNNYKDEPVSSTVTSETAATAITPGTSSTEITSETTTTAITSETETTPESSDVTETSVTSETDAEETSETSTSVTADETEETSVTARKEETEATEEESSGTLETSVTVHTEESVAESEGYAGVFGIREEDVTDTGTKAESDPSGEVISPFPLITEV